MKINVEYDLEKMCYNEIIVLLQDVSYYMKTCEMVDSIIYYLITNYSECVRKVYYGKSCRAWRVDLWETYKYKSYYDSYTLYTKPSNELLKTYGTK